MPEAWEKKLAEDEERALRDEMRAECVAAIETVAYEAAHRPDAAVVRGEIALYGHDYDLKKIAPILGALATELERPLLRGEEQPA